MKNNKLLIFSHRGNNKGFYENTIETINSVMLLPIDGIEIDIRLTKDKVPVLAHDKSLKRIAGLNILISSLTYSELIKIPIYEKYKIPKLSDVLTLINNTTILNIELKDIGSAHIVGDMLANLIDVGQWIPNNLIVSSKIVTELYDFNKLNLPISTALISGLFVTKDIYIAKNNFKMIVVNRHYLRKRHITLSHRYDLKTLVYTVNKTQSISRLAKIGVDGVFTDNSNMNYH